MTTVTILEQLVFDAIRHEENVVDDGGWGPMLSELVEYTGLDVKVLRGVLGSLRAKKLIYLTDGSSDATVLYCSEEYVTDALKSGNEEEV